MPRFLERLSRKAPGTKIQSSVDSLEARVTDSPWEISDQQSSTRNAESSHERNEDEVTGLFELWPGRTDSVAKFETKFESVNNCLGHLYALLTVSTALLQYMDSMEMPSRLGLMEKDSGCKITFHLRCPMPVFSLTATIRKLHSVARPRMLNIMQERCYTDCMPAEETFLKRRSGLLSSYATASAA